MYDFQKAYDNLKPILNETKLFYSDYFSEIGHNNVYIKPENLQKTGSFKIRGAYNKISKLDEDSKNKGIITASAGNHAQGVAYSANKQNIKAVIVMPETTPMIKVDGTLKYGAEVVLHGKTFDESNEYAISQAKEKGYTFIPPFDDPDVIEGQGTIAIDILNNLEYVDYILVPVGGGGLVSGIAKCAKTLNPYVKIIGVEPANAASMQESLKEGKIVKLDSVDTIADGTAVAKVGGLTYEISRDYVDDWISITEEEILETFTELMEKHKLVAEPSGILSIAASKKVQFFNKNIVCVVSGGNIDMSFISQLINKGLYASGRIHRFVFDLPHSPGNLVKLLDVFTSTKANILTVNQDAIARSSRFKNISVEVTVETNGKAHLNKIKNQLIKEGYLKND
ncbi:MAG: threonine ammonia-lyase [Tissierellia bacterium]|nr:threonine ammonia-lyase [Tissierellia bacterium]